MTSADGLIAVTPIFTTCYSGLFKSFVDVLDPDSLVDLPVLLGATGGTERHSLALDHAMRPLFTYLHARRCRPPCTPRPRTGASGDGGLQQPHRARGRRAWPARSCAANAPQVDPWALTTSFEDLLRDPS